MKFVSTRNQKNVVSFTTAMRQGLSHDGGLYTPIDLPEVFTTGFFDEKRSYIDLAFAILSPFIDDIDPSVLKACLIDAYQNNFPRVPTPLKKVGQDLYGLELFHGPTLAFKDVALSLLPKLLSQASSRPLVLLTATSGDTGTAALAGFKDVPNTHICVYYPHDGVSYIQEKQMRSALGNNVKVVGVRGNFDDCQRSLKQALTTIKNKEEFFDIAITSANSINIARLLAQMVYYAYSYQTLLEQGSLHDGDKVDFVVPSGNFGDILAGYICKRCGLPIRKLICATNANTILDDFIQTGLYDTHRPFLKTTSPSMDILISSNLERLLFYVAGDSQCKAYMESLQTSGQFKVDKETLMRIQDTFLSMHVDVEGTRAAILEAYIAHQTILDPHSAIAFKVAKSLQSDVPIVFFETASPFKFPSVIYQAIMHKDASDLEALAWLCQQLPLPSSLQQVLDQPARFFEVIDKEEVLGNIESFLRTVKP